MDLHQRRAIAPVPRKLEVLKQCASPRLRVDFPRPESIHFRAQQIFEARNGDECSRTLVRALSLHGSMHELKRSAILDRQGVMKVDHLHSPQTATVWVKNVNQQVASHGLPQVSRR